MTLISDVNNLYEILDILKKLQYDGTNWHQLGLLFGLLPHTLDVIERNHQGHTNTHCLLECLSAWLRQEDNVKIKGGPTWYTLIQALRSIEENAVADGIDKKSKLRRRDYN